MMIFGIILERILNGYLLLIILYAMMSWVPNLHNSSFRRFIAILVDPYLDIFRNKYFVIGMIDFSAMAGVFVLYMAIEGIQIIT